jgi:hypothetical protein
MIDPKKRRFAMRGTRFEREQIITISREAMAGVKLTDLSRLSGKPSIPTMF